MIPFTIKFFLVIFTSLFSKSRLHYNSQTMDKIRKSLVYNSKQTALISVKATALKCSQENMTTATIQTAK